LLPLALSACPPFYCDAVRARSFLRSLYALYNLELRQKWEKLNLTADKTLEKLKTIISSRNEER
jgi:hypothetical protein